MLALLLLLGGDGGGSNSPSREGHPRICYKLSRLFALTQPSSADRVRLRQSINSLATLIDVWIAAPRLLVVIPSPSREARGTCLA